MPRLVFFYMLPHTVGCMCSKGITSRKSPTAYSGLVATGKEKGTTKKRPPPIHSIAEGINVRLKAVSALS